MTESLLSSVDSGLRTLDPTSAAKLEDGGLRATTRSDPPGVEVEAIIRCAPGRIFELLTNYEEMPRHIYGLEAARVVGQADGAQHVRFSMKLPFPVGRVEWTNAIQTRQLGQLHAIEWSLVGGDLRTNEGRLVMASYRGQPGVTYSRYTVSVETRSALP